MHFQRKHWNKSKKAQNCQANGGGGKVIENNPKRRNKKINI